MDIQINYLAIIVCAVLSMIIGAIWYGPYFFGNTWLKISGIDPKDTRTINKMKKESGPLYGVQFLLTLVQLYILAHFIGAWSDVSGIEVALWVYVGFVMPILAGQAMWSGKPKKLATWQFLTSAGYQLLLFAIFGIILGGWK